MPEPRITGCIVTYNNMKTIAAALDSIFEFTDKKDFRLYVVDNFSTDGTPDFIRENYPQVCLLEPISNLGFGAGHNLVLPMLSSEVHFIINPDIILRDNSVEKMADYLISHPEAGIVSPRICFPDDGRDQILGKRNPKLSYLVASRLRRGDAPGRLLSEYAMLDCDLTKTQEIDVASGCFLAIRTSLFRDIGGFDERYFMYFEDFDLSREVKKRAKVVYYPEAVIYHAWGRESKRNLRLMRIHAQSMLKYFAKWNFKR